MFISKITNIIIIQFYIKIIFTEKDHVHVNLPLININLMTSNLGTTADVQNGNITLKLIAAFNAPISVRVLSSIHQLNRKLIMHFVLLTCIAFLIEQMYVDDLYALIYYFFRPPCP